MRLRHVAYKGVQFYVPQEEVIDVSADAVGMQHWMNDSLRSTLTYAEQIWYINRQLRDDLLFVLEAFCGFGMSTAPIADMRIEEHVAFDHDPGCCVAFKYLRPDAKVFRGDSYTLVPVAVNIRQYDYVLLEFNAMTTYRAMRDPKERAFMDAIFTSGARYVVFVDSAKVKEHLHRKTYSQYFDYEIESSDGYVRAVEKCFRETYGYSMVACAHDAINYTYLFDINCRPGQCDIFDTRPLVNLAQFKDLGYVNV